MTPAPGRPEASGWVVPPTVGPNTRRVLEAVLSAWPQHSAYLARHVGQQDRDLAELAEEVSMFIMRLVGGDVDRFARDYKWMCGLFLKAQLDYRRSGQLAASTGSIRELYYDNDGDMRRYMNGLLVSQVTWPQHLGAQLAFRKAFLGKLTPGYRYLEIGPGHGITLALVASDPNCGRLAGYDISQASLDMTRAALDRLGVPTPVDLRRRDVCSSEAGEASFDAICVSQVLELVSSPLQAVQGLAKMLVEGGRLFVNAPVRMIAPDHLRVWQDGSDVAALIESAGLVLESTSKAHADPADPSGRNGYSCLLVARKAS